MNWSNANNWTDPGGKANAPKAGGANNLQIALGDGTPAKLATTNQNQGNPFTLNTLLFVAKGPSYTINGNPLQFDSAAAKGSAEITNSSDGAISTVNVPIMLAKNLVLDGAADRLGTQPLANSARLVLSGTISENPANKGLSITVNNTGTAPFVLNAANTFTGGVTLESGGLVIGNNAALGDAKGTFTINGGMVRSSINFSASVGNPVTINGDFQEGEQTINRSLTFTGATTVTGVRTISVPDPSKFNPGPGVSTSGGSPLIFAGTVTTTMTDGIIAKGSDAGIGDSKAARIRNLGGVIRFNGDNSKTFQGSLEVAKGTVFVNGPMGSQATPVASVTVDNKARLGGSGGNNFTNITLPAGGKVTMNGTFQPGSSPGIFSLSGNMEFGNQSTFLWEFDGPKAGEGPDSYSQLIMSDGNVSLLSSGGSEPTLEVDVLGQTSLPVVGETYTLINMENTPFSRIVGDFMSPTGQDLTEGSTFYDYQGYEWQISYQGGPDQNDVTLTAVLEPGTPLLLCIGLAGAAVLGVRARRPTAISEGETRLGAWSHCARRPLLP